MRRLQRGGGGPRGQAMVEYIILTCLVLGALLGTIGAFLDAVGTWYLNIVTMICLPFP